MNLKFLLPTTLFGGAAASLGALVHAVITDGLASLTQFGIGGGLVAAVGLAVVRLYGVWKAAGGKFDGHTTNDEARSLIRGAAAELKLGKPLTRVAEQFAPQVADLGNRLVASVEHTVPGATELIGMISRYLNDPAEDSDHAALIWKFLDVLSKEITGNVAGEDLAAKLRDQFDLKLFPGTPPVTPANAT